MSDRDRVTVQGRRIDFHTHSLLSDGVLLPSELMRRVDVLDFEAVAITDHADASNLEAIIDSLHQLLVAQGGDWGTRLLVGVELTHVHPTRIDPLARRAKALGADIVVVHGETIVEPVAPGTNRAAVDSPAVDVLAHPGFITVNEARVAAECGCFVEITTRSGHAYTNGHVVAICRQAGAKMVVNSDSHEPSNLATLPFAQLVAAGAGLTESEVECATLTNPAALLSRVLSARGR